MKSKIILVVVVLLVGSILFWLWDGGSFDTVLVKQEEAFKVSIQGDKYRASLKGKGSSLFFNRVEEKLKGESMIVFYDGKPNEGNDYTCTVIAGATTMQDYVVDTVVSLGKVYMARHDANFVLNKAQTNIFNQAKEDGVELDLDKMIEVYHTKSDIEVIIPVLEKIH